MTKPQSTGAFPNAAKLAVGSALVAAIAVAYVVLSRAGALDPLTGGAAFDGVINRAGAVDPLAVIGLMAAAIVASPIPSAPIALASSLLTHFGSEIGSADPVRVTLAALNLGVVALVLGGAKVFLGRQRCCTAGRGAA